ncbi:MULTISPECIES: P-II family nitrogen regulator [Lacrimispora]|jgi:nitrogen regulatory protein P-II 1|uniref:Transcriptional regulator n=1 Tax=Lacrimispora algidixylanolytica TaxID=94868 RepID=A0A419T981_9FIRM|nr:MULTISPECIES: P-II family nitrogen regulator [Lacrimispora]RKD34034.1 transcriptional regulator [Lacrimispora algidixylanolytica]
MKKIEAFIRPEKLEDIKDIMEEQKLNGLSISQVMGCGNQKGWTEYVRGAEVDYNFLTKIKLEMVVADDQVETVISRITQKAYTGEYGDGKIFISDIQDAVRIRTGERGEDAIK